MSNEGEDAADADAPPPAVCEYGVCMVDATTATFSLGQFADDPARSRLRTLLAQQLPVEIVMEKVSFTRNVCVLKSTVRLLFVIEFECQSTVWCKQGLRKGRVW